MSAEPVSALQPTRRLRADQAESGAGGAWFGPRAAWLAIAGGFALIYAGSLELNEAESRVGLAIGAGLGPFGQVFGGWDPSVWPAKVAAGRIWAHADGGRALAGAIRWPSAIAAILLGALLCRRLTSSLGERAGLFAALAWFGGLALIDAPAGFVSMALVQIGGLLRIAPRIVLSGLGANPGVDLIAGLGTVAALDRIVGRRADLGAGLWAALAFLAGGWPPLAVIALATIVLGRREASLGRPLILPPLVAVALWSAWALSASPGAWGAALSLPLTQKPAWALPIGIAALSLPWGPLAILAASRSVREGWGDEGRSLVLGWLQVAGASAMAGTLVPGLSDAARLPAVAGLAMAAAACADRAWDEGLSRWPRRLLLGGPGLPGIAPSVVMLWGLLIIPGGIYLIMAVAYYRATSVVLVGLALATVLGAVVASLCGRARWAIGAVVAASIGLKIAHAGIYVPEWNYRLGQGPWGRAIGQWVPPKWPIYTLHPWPASLAFATGHPVVQIPDERVLPTLPGPKPQFVLLQPEEFAYWRKTAPRLIKLRTLQDEFGRERVLARTEGEFAWYRLIKEAQKD